MSNEWLAQVGADPRARAREIADAHSTFIATHAAGRCGSRASATSSPSPGSDRQPPRSTRLSTRRSRSPMATSTAYRAGAPAVAGSSACCGSSSVRAADDGDHLMAVSDAAGRLLWVEGHRVARRQARADELRRGRAGGTRRTPAPTRPAPRSRSTTRCRSSRPSTSGRPVQAWTCAAAPIHDPATGRLLGVIDITGGDGVANPHSLAPGPGRGPGRRGRAGAGCRAVRTLAAASLATPAGCDALGRGDGLLHRRTVASSGCTGGTPRSWSCCALHPDGLTGEQLAATALRRPGQPGHAAGRDDPAAPDRRRAARLPPVPADRDRSTPTSWTSRPRCAPATWPTALAAYAGPLLPGSDAPGVVAQRSWLDTQLRAAVLASRRSRSWSGPGPTGTASTTCRSGSGWRRSRRSCPPHRGASPRRAIRAAARRVRPVRRDATFDATFAETSVRRHT